MSEKPPRSTGTGASNADEEGGAGSGGSCRGCPRAGLAQAEPPKPKQLVFNASGGSQIASLRENYLNDFEKETGIKIVDTSPVDFGKLRAMVESGNVVWNITEIGGQDGYRVTQMGTGRADRCQDHRPQQVPAAGADEPCVLAELLLDGDLLSRRTRFRTARPSLGQISGTSRHSRVRAACAITPSTISRRRSWPTGWPRTSSTRSTSIAPSRSSTRSTSTSMCGGVPGSNRRSCS